MISSITIYSSARSSGHHQSDQESLVIFLGFLKMIKLLVILFIIYDGGFLQKYLTVKNHYLLTRKSSVIASEGFLISVWSLLFHHSLLKEPLEVDFKWNPLKWDFFQEFWSALKCFFSRILSGGQKVFYVYVKNEKNTLSDLSHVVRKSFSANESYHYFSFILKI